MWAGLSLGTITTRRLRTKTEGVAAISPLAAARVICAWLAEANTSAGAPCAIWVASVSEPPKLNLHRHVVGPAERVADGGECLGERGGGEDGDRAAVAGGLARWGGLGGEGSEEEQGGERQRDG